MMAFYCELHKAQKVERDANGSPYSWRGGIVIEKFTDPLVFVDYVHDHAATLPKNTVVFTTSGSMIITANNYLVEEQKKAGVLK